MKTKEKKNITNQNEDQIYKDVDLSQELLKNLCFQERGKRKELERLLNLLELNQREKNGLD